MSEKKVNYLSWILRGSQRKTIMRALNKRKTPTQISKETGIGLNNVSDILRSFVHEGLATCLNPDEKTGRLYELNKKGLRIRDEVVEYKV